MKVSIFLLSVFFVSSFFACSDLEPVTTYDLSGETPIILPHMQDSLYQEAWEAVCFQQGGNVFITEEMIHYFNEDENKNQIKFIIYLEDHTRPGDVYNWISENVIENQKSTNIRLTEGMRPSENKIFDVNSSTNSKKIEVDVQGYNSRYHWTEKHTWFQYIGTQDQVDIQNRFINQIIIKYQEEASSELWNADGFENAVSSFMKYAILLDSIAYVNELTMALSQHHVDKSMFVALYKKMKEYEGKDNLIFHIDGGSTHTYLYFKILQEMGYDVELVGSQYILQTTVMSINYDLIVDPVYLELLYRTE